MKDKRDSNIELLRIVAMLFIIAFHCVQHTGGSAFELMKSPFSMNLCITVLLGSFGNVSVALFVIISSWFLADREGIHSKKLVILTFQAWFLSMAVTGAVYALGYRKISLSIFFKEMLTPAYSQYWFITTYIVFYLTVPLLQYVVRTMREESLKKLCIIFTILIPCYNCFFVNVGDSLLGFYYLFLVMAYLKKKKNNWIERNAGKGTLISICLIVGCTLLINAAGNMLHSESLLSRITFVFQKNNILVYSAAICIFYLFQRVKIGKSGIINRFGKATFGVYILHENMLLRGGGEHAFTEHMGCNF